MRGKTHAILKIYKPISEHGHKYTHTNTRRRLVRLSVVPVFIYKYLIWYICLAFEIEPVKKNS